MFAPLVARAQAKTPASPVHNRPAAAANRALQDPLGRMATIQRAFGNQGMLRLLAARRAANLTGSGQIPLYSPVRPPASEPPSPAAMPHLSGAIQAKLEVGAVNDPLEHEADRVADQVMRMPASEVAATSAAPQISRKYAAREGEENRQKHFAGAIEGSVGEAPQSVQDVLQSPGQPLDPVTRPYFERRFGHDFGQVRVHDDARAAESARHLKALAYTLGRDVVFSRGHYRPRSRQGSELLAHELAHVIQQERGGPSPPPLRGGMLEWAADGAASAFVAGRGPVNVGGSSAPGVARQPQSDQPVVGISEPAPPYLRGLDARLQQMVDKQVKFFAEETASIGQIKNKYPPMPFREDAILDIPRLKVEAPLASIDLNSPHGLFQLHSRLYGGYELIDYHEPSVIIARDGIGYVLNDEIFSWLFGQEFPEFYEVAEGQPKFRHEHPAQAIFADIAMSSIPIPGLNPLAFIATFIMPFIGFLPGFGEFGAVEPGGFGLEPEGDFAPQSSIPAAAPADVAPPAKSGRTPHEPSVLTTEPESRGEGPKPEPPRAAPPTARTPGRWKLADVMTGTPYKPTQNVVYRGTVEKKWRRRCERELLIGREWRTRLS
jgi:Domain of unknown function (DUF4157)